MAIVALPLFAAVPGMAGSIVQPSEPDSLLDSGPTAPCAAGADYAAGVETNGQPVVPADVAAGRVPLPDTVAIPIGGNRVPGPAPRSGPNGWGRRSIPGRDASANGPDNASNRDSTYVALDGRKLEPLLNQTPCGAVR